MIPTSLFVCLFFFSSTLSRTAPESLTFRNRSITTSLPPLGTRRSRALGGIGEPSFILSSLPDSLPDVFPFHRR